MQKHNKYLVWTIWVATIAFIGAGFVGWGSYDLSSKAGSVAKVGDIEIKQTKLNMAYSNLYNQYNQMLEGKLDEKKAKEMGLIKQAFSTIAIQAKIQNFAKEMGIIVSNKELMSKLEQIQGFQKDGKFNKEIYHNYVKSQRIKAKDFEETLKEEILLQKTLALLEVKALPLEIEAISAAMNVSDKISYKVLTETDLSYTRDYKKLKAFWEAQKENYLTDTLYTLSLLWTSSDNTEITEEELKTYYEANSFKYTDAEGKQLSLDDAKEAATKDLKIKKTKKTAQKAYIEFKKDTLKENETLSLPLGDAKLTQIIWKEIQNKVVGDILKPKVVDDKYITIKIKDITKPKVMDFEKAKERVSLDYDKQEKKKSLLTLAENTLKTLDSSNPIISNYLSLTNTDNLESLNSQESLQFIQKLFTSNKEKGIISVLDKVIVYSILEQKLGSPESMDTNKTQSVIQTVTQVKKKTFESNLLELLDKKYPTEVYMEGLTN
ncbi:MAG: peptidylprolyl isomerase [Sulfurovum sp.]|nr:peptidylprolyl isomerase [Sulfurovum sp.]